MRRARLWKLMPQAAPIGREQELEQLLGLVRDATAGRGGIVFLAGPTGSGKSVLLKTLRERVETTPEFDPVETVAVLCYETGANNPLGPFVEIVVALAGADRRRTRARKVLELVREIAPPLLGFIPGLGTLAGAGISAASTVGIYALGGSGEAEQKQIASDLAASLAKVAAEEAPLVLVVDDAHWIDAASCEVVARLAHTVGAEPLLLVLAYDPDLVTDAHPLMRTRYGLAAQDAVRVLTLEDLGLDAIAALLRDRYGADLNPNLAPWLLDVSEGNLLFVDRHLRALEECGAIRSANGGYVLDGVIEGSPGDWRLEGVVAKAGTPESLLDVVRPRLDDLDDEERNLLESGSVQGPRFFSTVLVDLLGAEERQVLDRLHRIEDRRRLISVEQSEGWWTDYSDLYSFDPGVVRELFYARYARSPHERRQGHLAVAEALERLLGGDAVPPRLALLEIAAHYEKAGRPVEAARRLLQAAGSTLEEGATRDAQRHSEKALSLLRTLKDGEPDAELLARTIVLYLVASQPRWESEGGRSGAELLALADEAYRAAEEIGDLALQAEARYAKGNLLVAFDSLERAIETFREARRLAQEAVDTVGEFSILLKLGHHLDSLDLRAGRDVLRDAQALVTSGALAGKIAPRQLTLAQARLEMRIGVAEFDLGDYGEAFRLLPGAIEQLRAGRLVEETGWGLSFLGQLYTALGLYEAAEAVLQEGIGLFADEKVAAARGYLTALLGRLYLEWEPPRPEEAGPLLESGRDETERSGNRSVRPLTDVYYAGLLLARGDRGSLEAADHLLAGTRSVSDETGWARSAIAARSVAARVALALGHPADAARLSTEAVELLRKCGEAVPTVRTEEIYFTHATVLAATGSPDAGWLAKAADVVREKAEKIPDRAQHDSFLGRVRLSREILAAEADQPLESRR
jgi:tetratricopeptide (TPR) repeat protein